MDANSFNWDYRLIEDVRRTPEIDIVEEKSSGAGYNEKEVTPKLMRVGKGEVNPVQKGDLIKVLDVHFKDKEREKLVGRTLEIQGVIDDKSACICTGRHWWQVNEVEYIEKDMPIPKSKFDVGDKVSFFEDKFTVYEVIGKKFTGGPKNSEWRYSIQGRERSVGESELRHYRDVRPQIIGEEVNAIDWPKFCEEYPREAARYPQLPTWEASKLQKKFKDGNNLKGLIDLIGNKSISERIRKDCELLREKLIREDEKNWGESVFKSLAECFFIKERR